MDKTFYLKYRPQLFSDLDSLQARKELVKIFSSGKIPHAFLFSGPKGIGKTSAARIVAKAVNCEMQRCKDAKMQSKISESMKLGREAADEALKLSYEPCNECDNCVSITNGTNLDVLEIDAASNRGIEDIKELREKIKLAPAVARYKVYIIDEVHMLTPEAFNALLKTLEEPPLHAIFILCTTDPEKLPKTIISRCQRINFKRAVKEEIINRLQKICLEEKLEFEQQALKEIAKLADGSFRDANKLLGQVSLAGKVSLSAVWETVGILGEFAVNDFLDLLKKREIKECLTWIDRASNSGVNFKILIENILENLHLIFLQNFGIVEEEETLVDFSVEETKTLLDLFSRAYQELKSAVIPQLPLEIAVVEWGENKLKVKSEKLKVDESETKYEHSEAKGKSNSSVDKSDGSSQRDSVNKTFNTFSLEEVLSKWPEILGKIKPLNHSVLAFLRACRPLTCENGFLVLEVFYKFHKDQLESEKCRRLFEKVASEVIGQPIKLKCQLSEKKPSFVPSDVKAPVEANASTDKTKDEDDIIKMAEEIFNK